MTANKTFTIGAVGLTAIIMAAAALVLLGPQPASAAGWDSTRHAEIIDQQSVPEPPPPDGQPGEGPAGGGEPAVADGGSATPYVIAGIGVLLVLALFAAYWVSRKPAPGDLDADATLRNEDSRYIPPGI